MSEEEWDRVSLLLSYLLLFFDCIIVQLSNTLSQCWSANVKVPKALLTEARATFDANPDGGHMITTGSIAVCLLPSYLPRMIRRRFVVY
jgi:hypothetical protein